MANLILQWKTKEGELKSINELTDKELNEAYIQAQRVYYKAHKTMMKMDGFIELFELEAEERKQDLIAYKEKTKANNIKEFFENEAILQNAKNK